MDLNDLTTGLVDALHNVPEITAKGFNKWSPHVRAYFKKRGDELGNLKAFPEFGGHGGLVYAVTVAPRYWRCGTFGAPTGAAPAL